MQPNYINANDFIETLKSQGLVIVSLSEFELNNSLIRKRLMKKKAVSCAEILQGKLLPLKTAKGIIDWTLNGKIKETEFYNESTGKRKLMIMTSAIKRLGYDD